MKGIQVNKLGGPEMLEYVDLPDPIPQSHQVLIEVKCVSVNFADLKARSGKYHLGKKPPFIPGIDVAGVIIGKGADVSGLHIGERVIAFPFGGSYAEKVIADANLTFVLPDSVDYKTAAACPIAAGTATHSLLHVARMKEGETLLIHAAGGGVGSTALKIAKVLNPSFIAGSTGSSWKIKEVLNLGADAVIDYADPSYPDKIKEMTEGKGIDVILNPIGGETAAKDIKCLAPFGRLVLLGKIGDTSIPVPLESLHAENRSVLGVSFGHYRRFRPELVRETMETVIGLLEDKRFDIAVAADFPLKYASEAHRYVEERRGLGKVVMIP